ncbi:hypothetical protein HRR83_002649 [Exophiala dermatitidis]|uniref:Uncharacterized protein n=1 Tax=Exophiala dermatitidis TaxID=5970 RepID=A0AAN6ITC8_EXODE|nr:hypothetical protein HRR74_009268 [Exophiala dermatitidis]KAJ4514563.1 hypothetical protein HRR73_005591 [Exophiala dermatitidis]KAJ4531820.1 hypothetical protein HRR77_009094 [Exophiala dermatitidis]KAJ4537419.1 hypothetical protein HRR76_005425 [Exophiala dermatitidis]KAJ4566182.1 hypothetical protein HRR79_005202 [Exophiala dermatitidis]
MGYCTHFFEQEAVSSLAWHMDSAADEAGSRDRVWCHKRETALEEWRHVGCVVSKRVAADGGYGYNSLFFCASSLSCGGLWPPARGEGYTVLAIETDRGAQISDLREMEGQWRELEVQLRL